MSGVDEEGEWQYEEASEQEKLQIAQHFLTSSPPGEIHDVLRDVVKLVPEEILTESVLRGAMHAHNVHNTLPVAVSDANYKRESDVGNVTVDWPKVLICEESQVDPAHYVDCRGRRVLGFDHIKQQFLMDDVSNTVPSSGALEEDRGILQKALERYLADHYADQGACGVYASDENKLVLRLCAERINLRNFWSGRWSSRWELDVAQGSLSGRIQLHVHYFENGNLQLKEDKQVDSQVLSLASKEKLGEAVISAIQTAEDTLQSNLEDMYLNMSQETFKEMRRVMPVTQSKMEWSVHAHRTARDLGRK